MYSRQHEAGEPASNPTRLSHREQTILRMLLETRAQRELNGVEASILATMVEEAGSDSLSCPTWQIEAKHPQENHLSLPSMSFSSNGSSSLSHDSLKYAAAQIHQAHALPSLQLSTKHSGYRGPLVSSSCFEFNTVTTNFQLTMEPVKEEEDEAAHQMPSLGHSSDTNIEYTESSTKLITERMQKHGTEPSEMKSQPEQEGPGEWAALGYKRSNRRCQSPRIPRSDHEIRLAQVYHSLSLNSGGALQNPFVDQDPQSPSYIVPRPNSTCSKINGPLADLFEDEMAEDMSAETPPRAYRKFSNQSSVYSRDEDGESVAGEAMRWPARSSSLGALLQIAEEEAKQQVTVTVSIDSTAAETVEHSVRVKIRRPHSIGGYIRVSQRVFVRRELRVKFTGSLQGVRRLARRSSQVFRRQ